MEHAMRGQTKGETTSHLIRECKERYGIQPDEQMINMGYDQGLKRFCTPDSMKDFASRGGYYKGICPVDDPKAMDGYRTGRIQFLERQVDSLEWEISSLKSKVSSLESELSSAKTRCNK